MWFQTHERDIWVEALFGHGGIDPQLNRFVVRGPGFTENVINHMHFRVAMRRQVAINTIKT